MQELEEQKKEESVKDNDDEKKVENDTELQDIRVLFLDVDGVLNTYDGFSGYDPKEFLKKEMTLRLKAIIEKTNCKIVLSSSWRLEDKDKKKLFTKIREQTEDTLNIYNDLDKKDNIYIGDTPDLDPDYDKMEESARTEEILYFIENNLSTKNGYNLTNWCAVDDLELGKLYSSNDGKFTAVPQFDQHFCNTTASEGITEDKMVEIIKILTS